MPTTYFVEKVSAETDETICHNTIPSCMSIREALRKFVPNALYNYANCANLTKIEKVSPGVYVLPLSDTIYFRFSVISED